MKKFLVGMFLILIAIAIFSNINIYAAAPSDMKGVWVWSSTVRQLGPDGVNILINDLKNGGFTDLFLLVKGMKGIAEYPSKVALAVASESGDQLKEIITEAHKNNIRVHAWIMAHGDSVWVEKYPADRMVHITNGPKPGTVSLLSSLYQQYIQSIVQELIGNYDIDGIQLDGIRFTHVAYSFDKYMLAEARKRKISIEKVKSTIEQDIQGASAILSAYQNGDPTIVAWERLRRDAIVGFAQGIKDIVKNANRPLLFSAAFMPEGSFDPNTADVHYAQNYKDAVGLYDFITPMAYWKDFKKEPQWVGSSVVRQAALTLGKDSVVAGLQAYEVQGNLQIAQATESAIANGAKGISYFRYGTFAFARVQEVKDEIVGKTLLTVELTNRSGVALDTIELFFNGTGLTVKSVVNSPAGVNVRMSKNNVSLTGEQILGVNQTIAFTIEVERKSDKKNNTSPVPLIYLSLQKRTFVPVCAVSKAL